MQHICAGLTSYFNILCAFIWKAAKLICGNFNNMHKRVELKQEAPAMDIENSANSDASDGEDTNDQNSIANLVIKLFNKKVR